MFALFSKTLKLFVAACVYMCARSNTFILYRKYFEKISGGFFGVLAMSPTHLRRTSPSLIFSLLSPEEKPRTQETQSVTFGRRKVRWKSVNSTEALRRLHSLTCVWIPRDSGNSISLLLMFRACSLRDNPNLPQHKDLSYPLRKQKRYPKTNENLP